MNVCTHIHIITLFEHMILAEPLQKDKYFACLRKWKEKILKQGVLVAL